MHPLGHISGCYALPFLSVLLSMWLRKMLSHLTEHEGNPIMQHVIPDAFVNCCASRSCSNKTWKCCWCIMLSVAVISIAILCLCRQLYYQELVGKAKERAAREEAKKAEARDEFTRLLRHTKSLKLESTWEDINPDLETHSAYKDVSDCHLPRDVCHGVDALMACCTTNASFKPI